VQACTHLQPHRPGPEASRASSSSPPDDLFRVDEENDRDVYCGSGPRGSVLFFGTNASILGSKRLKPVLRLGIWRRGWSLLAGWRTQRRLRRKRRPQLVRAGRAIQELEQFLVDVKRAGEDSKNRIVGHIVLSPPLVFSAGDDGSTQDFGVIEVDINKIDATNFIGKAIDLGTTVSRSFSLGCTLTKLTNVLFKYPPGRLLRLYGALSIAEMCKSDSKNVDSKATRPSWSSSLAAALSSLSDVCLVLRKAFKKPGVYSREVAVLPRTSKSGAFSNAGRAEFSC